MSRLRHAVKSLAAENTIYNAAGISEEKKNINGIFVDLKSDCSNSLIEHGQSSTRRVNDSIIAMFERVVHQLLFTSQYSLSGGYSILNRSLFCYISFLVNFVEQARLLIYRLRNISISAFVCVFLEKVKRTFSLVLAVFVICININFFKIDVLDVL